MNDSAPSKLKRRWHQFSNRKIVLVAVLACLGFVFVGVWIPVITAKTGG